MMDRADPEWRGSVAVVFFVLSVLTAITTFLAVVAPRRPMWLGFVSFAFGLVPSELPFVYLLWSAVLLIVFGVLGTFETTLGILASALLVAAAVGELVIARRSVAAGRVIERALRDGFGADYGQHVDPALAAQFRHRVALAPVLMKPFASRRRDVVRVKDLAYGDAGVRNMLDVYHHRARPANAPVLLYIHGGAWTTGKKDQQGLPLIYHFAARGWLCVAPNYRLCPAATFPDPLVDIKRVIAWIREHAAEHGGDPSQLFVAGGSAGGHLTALAALTANDPALQPGFEDADTSITAAIPLYGDYDWLDCNAERSRRGRLDRTSFFMEKILKCSADSNRALWEQGSPLFHVRADAPPFFVLHGDRDTLLLVEDARHFVEALHAVSTAPVLYAELPGAQHAFDMFQSVRCGHVVNGVERFTASVRSNLRTTTEPLTGEAARDSATR
jgi:acetyl esterase/lipase